MSRLWNSIVAGAVGALAAGAIVAGTSGGGVDEATASHGGFHVSAGQLRINQRISQAALRRVNAVTERMDDGAEVLSAVVSRQGALVRGRGATDAANLFFFFKRNGVYEVIFNRDVTACTFVAGLGDPGHGAADPGFVTTARREFHPDRIRVETFDTSGEPALKAFHVTVTC